MTSGEFHCIYWAPKDCSGRKEDDPFIRCCALGFYSRAAGGWRLAALGMELGASTPEGAESMSLCVNHPGLKLCGCLTLFLAWPGETPSRRQVWLAELWRCLWLPWLRLPMSNGFRAQVCMVGGGCWKLFWLQEDFLKPSELRGHVLIHYLSAKM